MTIGPDQFIMLLLITAMVVVWVARQRLISLYRAVIILRAMGRVAAESPATGVEETAAESAADYAHPQGSREPYSILTPNGRPNGRGIILLHGASPFAEDHPTLRKLASALTRVGFTVYLPRMPKLKALLIDRSTTETIGAIYRHISSIHGWGPRELSLIGTSFSGAALLKAEAASNWGDIPPGQILTFGTYCRLESSLRFVLTGEAIHGAHRFAVQPDPWGQIIFFHNFLDHLEREFDISAVREIIQHYLDGNDALGEAAMLDLQSPELEIAQTILTPSSSAALTMAEEIIHHAHSLMDSLSVPSFGSLIRRPVWVLHGQQDESIPYTEALSLGDELGEMAQVFVAGNYGHKNDKGGSGIIERGLETVAMVRFMARFFNSVNYGTEL